jgi:pimeloyl-ACP methyl ester carboxylesterase
MLMCSASTAAWCCVNGDVPIWAAGQLHLRCTIEEQIYQTVKHPAMQIRGQLHRLQCPCVFASGAPKSTAEQDMKQMPTLLPRAAYFLSRHVLDSAYVMFPGATHFMPFVRPRQLAESIVHCFTVRQSGQGLREHIRWLAVVREQEQNLRLIGLDQSKL